MDQQRAGRTRLITHEPRRTRLMLRAAATSRRRGGDLPDVAVEHRGIRVDPAHLAAYARVCGYATSGTLPATYLHVLTFGLQLEVMADRGFPLPLPGLVHVVQSLQQLRPVGVTERLEVIVRAADLRPHRRGRQVDLVAEATVAGRPVWRGVSTYLARGGEPQTSGTSSDRLELAVDPTGPPAARWQVTADTGRRYAAVSGDVNPIHLHPLTARALGFPQAIAHGMWSAARCLAAVGPWVPPEHEVDVRFRRPLRLPSSVELRTARPTDEPRGMDLLLSGRMRDGVPGVEHLAATVRPLS